MYREAPCFYMPKQIMTPQYAAFSVESKLLFSMIFTNAEHIKALTETAELIERIGEKELYNMRHMYEENFRSNGEESEG